MANATAAIAAAGHVGVPFADAVAALASFAGVKRRLELLGRPAGVAVYDDFAHHPTAIRATLAAMRAQPSSGRVIALIEPRSNTMRSGEHKEELALSASDADGVLWYEPPGLDWNLGHTVGDAAGQEVFSSVTAMIERAVTHKRESWGQRWWNATWGSAAFARYFSRASPRARSPQRPDEVHERVRFPDRAVHGDLQEAGDDLRLRREDPDLLRGTPSS